jgi:hypothetical protein
MGFAISDQPRVAGAALGAACPDMTQGSMTHHTFARREPIFVLEFDAALLTLRQNKPQIAPLSQLPP